MSLDPELLRILVCPACRAALHPPTETGIECSGCRLVYPIRDGIPVMLVDEASPAPNLTQSGPGLT